jgi:hypothetical protein
MKASINRRNFIKAAAVSGIGLGLTSNVPGLSFNQKRISKKADDPIATGLE